MLQSKLLNSTWLILRITIQPCWTVTEALLYQTWNNNIRDSIKLKNNINRNTIRLSANVSIRIKAVV